MTSTVNRLEVWCWLDGPLAAEGRVGGPARALLLRMNRQALGAANVGDEHEPAPAWPRLDTLTLPVRVIVGTFESPARGHERPPRRADRPERGGSWSGTVSATSRRSSARSGSTPRSGVPGQP